MKRTAIGTSVNVIYFTTQCNFACKYCYEALENKKVVKLSRSKIIKIVDDIISKEPKNEQTLFVMFGGEVTLEWENAKFLMDYAMSLKENVHFNISTNGYRFKSQKFIDEYKSTKAFKEGKCSLDISFDGIGNNERILKNGKDSTPALLKIFKLLHKNNINFRLRYTIHNKNFDFLKNDLINLANYIKPLRIITSVAYSTLNNEQIKQLENIKKELLNLFKNGIIKIPICEFFCENCNGCSLRKEFKSYFSNKGNINKLKSTENAGLFKDFERS